MNVSKDLTFIQEGLEKLNFFKNEKLLSIKLHSCSLFSLYKISFKNSKKLAVKIISSEKMAIAEKDSLEKIIYSGALAPKTLGIYSINNQSCLFMEFVEGNGNINQEQLSEHLIKLYSQTNDKFGYASDNFIGNLNQKNNFYTNFSDFFWEARLLPQIELAIKNHNLTFENQQTIFKLFFNLVEKWDLDSVQPRLIHGDLWSGNIIPSFSNVYLIDPCVSYSHAEQDIGMLELFGNPLSTDAVINILSKIGIENSKTIQDRLPFWQIYPILVHINIFGFSYLNSLKKILDYYH